MKDAGVKELMIVSLVLLNLWTTAAIPSPDPDQEGRLQEAQSRIDCVMCKIISLGILMAIPVIIFLGLPVFLLFFALSVIFYDKWRKAKDDPAARSKAKKALCAIIVLTSAFLLLALAAAVVLFMGILGGDCTQACDFIRD